MTRHTRRLAIAAGAILIAAGAFVGLAGCSSNPKPAAHTSATPAAPAVSLTPLIQTATVTQYASALNGPINDLQDTWKKYNDQGCPIDDSSVACQLMPDAFGTEAQIIVTTIEGSEKQGAGDYIGAPPAEIAQLVADTSDAAQKVANDLDDPQHPAQGWGFDLLTLNSQLDKWGPYLH